MRHAGLLALCCVLLAVVSCSGPVMVAVGESNDLVIVVDDVESPAARLLTEIMEHESIWLGGEPAFVATVTTPRRLGELRNRRHLMLAGSWGGGEVRDLVRKYVRGLREGDDPRLQLDEDIWAKGQAVAAVMADDPGDLVAYLEAHREEILRRFEDAATDRLSRTLSDRAAQAGATAMLKERYGWSICLPSGYDFYSAREDAGFVFFRRLRPDRSVFVFWMAAEPGTVVSPDWVTDARDRLTAESYDGDVIEWKRPVLIDTVDFRERTAVRISGWWANRELFGGGPFRTYAFVEPTQERLYLIDISLFGPGTDKAARMRSLDAIARSFATSP